MRDLCCTGCTPIINQVKISLLTEKKNSAGCSASVALPTIRQKRFLSYHFPVEINYARVKIGPMFFCERSEQKQFGIFTHAKDQGSLK